MCPSCGGPSPFAGSTQPKRESRALFRRHHNREFAVKKGLPTTVELITKADVEKLIADQLKRWRSVPRYPPSPTGTTNAVISVMVRPRAAPARLRGARSAPH